MNKLDKQYTDLLQDILDNGIQKSDRTGTGTLSVFGRQIRHKMSDGFPLLTTKKMYFKGIATELLWFLRGDTNIKYLVNNDCHIWDGDALKRYWKEGEKEVIVSYMPLLSRHYNREEFINKIKTDDEFAKKWGELGPIYGSQWRGWGRYNSAATGWFDPGVDQIANLINELKTNPDSRRLMVNAWNVGELDQMVLPPCHYVFQVYTRELDWKERVEIARKTLIKENFDEYGYISPFTTPMITGWLNQYNIPIRTISLMWNQRSVDVPLGLPFNIASYALLLEIIAKEVNMVPEDLIGNLGDCHIYNNQIEGVKEQLTRQPFELPTLIFEKEIISNIFSIEQSGRNNFNVVSPDDFQIENYQSHPAIKIPLSN